MIAYLLKSILCSGLLILFYFLLLEKEKMHRFNRWYLLCSLIFSLTIPLLDFTIPAQPSAFPVANDLVAIIPIHITNIAITQVQNRIDWLVVTTISCYGFITLILLSRFLTNIVRLRIKANRNKQISFHSATLVLVKEKIIPYTFFQTIFLNEEEYKNNKSVTHILAHELTHVHQLHTIDVLLIETLRVFLWFNPFFLLYKKAIQLNHEFLADKEVVKKFDDPRAYQYLLLERIAKENGLSLTSQFNYLVTKKRLTMITKQTPTLRAVVKKLTILSLLILLALFFSNKTVGQDSLPSKVVGTTIESNPQDATSDILKEYQAIIDKYKDGKDKWADHFFSHLTDEDRDKLESLFKKMSREQQKKQDIIFSKPLKPLPRISPTEKQLKDFSDASEYGVWIDGKKVSNSTLANYNPTDFAQVFISKLYGKARTSVSYNYQADLMTIDYYQKYYDASIANTRSVMMLRWQGIK
jgi:bla regulator protein BlaR1